jgi:hypothetical protein
VFREEFRKCDRQSSTDAVEYSGSAGSGADALPYSRENCVGAMRRATREVTPEAAAHMPTLQNVIPRYRTLIKLARQLYKLDPDGSDKQPPATKEMVRKVRRAFPGGRWRRAVAECSLQPVRAALQVTGQLPEHPASGATLAAAAFAHVPVVLSPFFSFAFFPYLYPRASLLVHGCLAHRNANPLPCTPPPPLPVWEHQEARRAQERLERPPA